MANETGQSAIHPTTHTHTHTQCPSVHTLLATNRVSHPHALTVNTPVALKAFLTHAFSPIDNVTRG